MLKALIAFVGLTLLLVWISVFTVNEREKAMLLQFGQVQRADYAPGLHFKWPWQNVIRFDARIQTLDSPPESYLTSEKKQVIVDAFVKWRIADVERYFTSVGGVTSRANDRLSAVILKQLRDEFGKRSVKQVVSGQRIEIMSALVLSSKQQADELGIEIFDVRVKRVDLPRDVSESVFRRMRAERERVAKQFRAEGGERASEIRAEADRQKVVILAEAERDGQKIRGDGDARATETYATAFGQDEGFYSLYRSLDAYRNSLGSSSDIMVMEPDSQFFRFFKDASGGK